MLLHSTGGDVLTCDACVVTIPLTCLQKEMIEMIPEMPSDKLNAIKQLGAGIIEKVYPTC